MKIRFVNFVVFVAIVDIGKACDTGTGKTNPNFMSGGSAVVSDNRPADCKAIQKKRTKVRVEYSTTGGKLKTCDKNAYLVRLGIYLDDTNIVRTKASCVTDMARIYIGDTREPYANGIPLTHDMHSGRDHDIALIRLPEFLTFGHNNRPGCEQDYFEWVDQHAFQHSNTDDETEDADHYVPEGKGEFTRFEVADRRSIIKGQRVVGIKMIWKKRLARFAADIAMQCPDFGSSELDHFDIHKDQIQDGFRYAEIVETRYKGYGNDDLSSIFPEAIVKWTSGRSQALYYGAKQIGCAQVRCKRDGISPETAKEYPEIAATVNAAHAEDPSLLYSYRIHCAHSAGGIQVTDSSSDRK